MSDGAAGSSPDLLLGCRSGVGGTNAGEANLPFTRRSGMEEKKPKVNYEEGSNGINVLKVGGYQRC